MASVRVKRQQLGTHVCFTQLFSIQGCRIPVSSTSPEWHRKAMTDGKLTASLLRMQCMHTGLELPCPREKSACEMRTCSFANTRQAGLSWHVLSAAMDRMSHPLPHAPTAAPALLPPSQTLRQGRSQGEDMPADKWGSRSSGSSRQKSSTVAAAPCCHPPPAFGWLGAGGAKLRGPLAA